jgi:mannitol 2-dehydrogenase
LKAGQSIDGLALESALWCRYCFGTTENGNVIEPNDPEWAALQERARKAKSDPDVWLAMQEIYGETGNSPVFRKSFAKSLNSIWETGTEATIRAYLAN